MIFQDRSQHVTRILIVLDDQNAEAGQRRLTFPVLRGFEGHRRRRNIFDRRLADRQPDDERRSLVSAFAVGRYVSAVHLHEVRHDRKTEAESARASSMLTVRLPKAFKDEWQKSWFDADPVVPDLDLDTVVLIAKKNINVPVLLRKFDGICKQVEKHLLETFAIGFNMRRRVVVEV